MNAFLKICLIFVAAIAGLTAFFHPTFFSGFELIQTDPGDTRLNNYILEHSYLWITGNPLHANFWDPPVFYPARNTASYSEILLSSAPVYWLLRFMNLQPDTAFQLWMPLIALMNFLAALLLFRSGMRLNVIAAVGGAYIFAFSGIRANQLNIQQLLPQFFSVLAIYNLFKIFDDQSSYNRTKSAIVMFFIFVVLQLYTGFYLGFFLCFGLTTALIVSIAFREARVALIDLVKDHWVTIVVSLVLAGVLLSWQAVHYIAGQMEVGVREWDEIVSMIPRALSWLDTGPGSLVYKWTRNFIDFSKLPVEAEHRISPGPATLVICAAGLVYAFRIVWARVVLIVCVIVAMTAFLYPGDWSPWKLVVPIFPGAGAIRAVTRVSFLLLIGLSIGASLFLGRMRSPWLAVALIVLMALEQVQSSQAYSKQEMRAEIAKIAARIPDDCKSFYFAIGTEPGQKPRPWFEYQLDGMWASVLKGRPTANGFSGNIPPNWWQNWDPIIKSGADLTRLRINLFKWAELNGMNGDDICLVTLPDEGSAGRPAHVGKVELKMGASETRLFLGEGWGEDEWDGDASWVWGIGTSASMFVPLKPDTRYLLEIHAAPMVVPGNRQEMRIRVNGSELSEFQMQKGSRVYKTDIPGHLVKDLNKVELHFAFAIPPAALGSAPDMRSLAVSFEKIGFYPLDER